MKSVRPILLIDLHSDSREVLAMLLRAFGYLVVVAEHGDEALRMLQMGLRPCLIMLDLVVPGDGWSFRIEQLKDPELARIPVIGGATIAKTQDHVDRALHVEAIMLKPFDLDELQRALARHCAVPDEPPDLDTPPSQALG
jgi:CheY-like chemotaxis protein